MKPALRAHPALAAAAPRRGAETRRFSGVETAATAFAANLLGAMVGGTLEYLSLITGYQFLLIVTAVLHGLAFVTGRRRTAAHQPGQP